jgi:hypothetical protein
LAVVTGDRLHPSARNISAPSTTQHQTIEILNHQLSLVT